MKQKLVYLPPSIEIVAMENEGIIASSTESMNPGNGNWSASSAGFGTGAASSSDLEDMINDILTIE